MTLLEKTIRTIAASSTFGAIFAVLTLLTGQSLTRVTIAYGLGFLIAPSIAIVIYSSLED